MDKKAILAGCFLLLAAAPQSRPDPITRKLSVKEMAKIKRGEIVLRSTTEMESKSGRGFAVGLIKATPKEIWKTILDYDRYAEFMTRVSGCKTTTRTATRIDTDFTLDMGLADVSYSIIHTLHPDKYRLTWVLDKNKPADYLTETVGHWQLEPLPDGGTLVEYSVEAEVDIPVIGWLIKGLVKKLTRDDLPSVVGLLRKRVESGNTWKK